MKNIVIFDIDGVIADFEGKLVTSLYERFGIVAFRNRHLFSLEERYEGEMLECAKELTSDPNFYYPLEVIGGGVAFVNMCIGFGSEIVFVSSRPEQAGSFTRRWLKKVLSTEDFGLKCGIFDKAKILDRCQDEVDFIVEDNPKNIQELKDIGFSVLCWDQEWNQGIFPRAYQRIDGTIMIWKNEETEAEPFESNTVVGEC